MTTDAVLSALGASMLVPVLHILLIRLSGKPERAVRYEFIIFALVTVLWTSAFVYVRGLDIAGLVGGLATLGFMLLGYMEAFSMLCRGFSLHIMTDLEEAGPMDIDAILRNYGGGKGVDWLMDKRLAGLVSLGLIRRQADTLLLGGKGATFFGHLGLTVKSALKMGAGG